MKFNLREGFKRICILISSFLTIPILLLAWYFLASGDHLKSFDYYNANAPQYSYENNSLNSEYQKFYNLKRQIGNEVENGWLDNDQGKSLLDAAIAKKTYYYDPYARALNDNSFIPDPPVTQKDQQAKTIIAQLMKVDGFKSLPAEGRNRLIDRALEAKYGINPNAEVVDNKRGLGGIEGKKSDNLSDIGGIEVMQKGKPAAVIKKIPLFQRLNWSGIYWFIVISLIAIFWPWGFYWTAVYIAKGFKSKNE